MGRDTAERLEAACAGAGGHDVRAVGAKPIGVDVISTACDRMQTIGVTYRFATDNASFEP